VDRQRLQRNRFAMVGKLLQDLVGSLDALLVLLGLVELLV
jgi:hypothetical protein